MKRYELEWSCKGFGPSDSKMCEDPEGEYVRHSDLAALLAERDAAARYATAASKREDALLQERDGLREAVMFANKTLADLAMNGKLLDTDTFCAIQQRLSDSLRPIAAAAVKGSEI